MKLKGWKEITPGAVITEAGSALKFKTGSWRAFKPRWLEENCIQCMFCWLYCPDMAIKVKEGRGRSLTMTTARGAESARSSVPERRARRR